MTTYATVPGGPHPRTGRLPRRGRIDHQGRRPVSPRYVAALGPEPLIVATAQRAREAGVKVALLTNSFGLKPYNPYEALGRGEDHFDAFVLSERGGVRKPSPFFYQRALEKLELTGPDVFVDDHARNLPPAEALGIRTVHHTTDPAATAALLDRMFLDRIPPEGSTTN